MRDRKGTFRRAVGLLLALRAREAEAIFQQLAVSYGQEGVERDERAEAALVLATAGYCSRQLRRFDEADKLLRRAGALLADAAGADGVGALPAAFLAGAASAACCLEDVEPWELCCIDLTRVISSPLPSAKASPGADGCWRAATATEDVPITVLLHTKTRTTLVLSPASSFRFGAGPDTPLQLCGFEASILRTAGTNPESVQLYTGPYQRKILRAVETLTSAIERGSGKSISRTWSWEPWSTVSSTPKANSDSGAVKIVHAEWPTTCSLVLTDEGFVLYGTETTLVVEHGRVRNDDNPSSSLELDEEKDAGALADLTDHPELAFKIGVTVGLSLLPPAAIGGVGSRDGDCVGGESGEVLRGMACKLKHVGAVKDIVQCVEMLVVGGSQLHIAAATGNVKALAEGLLLVECCQADGSVGGVRSQLSFGCNCLNCVNGRDSKGRTAMNVAAAMFSDFRHLRVLEALVEKGARVDVRSQEGLLQSPACLAHQKPPTVFERAVELLSCEAVFQESSAPAAGPQVGSIVTIISRVMGAPADRTPLHFSVGERLEIAQVMHWQNAWYATCTRYTTLWFPLSSTDWRDGGLQLGAEPLPLSPILMAIKSQAPHAILAFDRLLHVLYQRECKAESKSAALATLHAQEIGDTKGASTVLELTCKRLRDASSQQHREAALRALARMLYASAVKPVLRNGITFASFQPPACMETVVPAGVALTAIGLAMNDGRHDVSAGVPLSGVLSGLVTVNSLLRAGWKVHRRIRDCRHGAPSTLEFDPGKGAWVLIGALDLRNPGFFVLAAAAGRKDVFKKTSGSTTHLANGVYWYNSSNSFGFSGHPHVRLEDGQDVCDEEGESRLSISTQYLRRDPGFGRSEGPPLSRVGMRKFDACESTWGWEVIIMYFDGTGQGGERATNREWVLGERVSLVKEARGQVFEATRLDGTPCQVPAHTLKTPTVVEKGRGNLQGKWCISATVSGPITCWIEGAYLQPVDRFPDNICLAGCKLECLPSSAELHAIGCSSLVAVRRLSLSDNMLHTLPADFNGVMPCISDLDLSKNRFASYPTVLGDCLHLKEVNLVRNSLSKTDWLREILNKWPHFATDPPVQLEAIRLDFPCTSTDAQKTLILTLSRRTIERSTSTCIDLRERGLGGVIVDELQQPLGEAFDCRQGVGKALQETLRNEQSLSRIHTHRLKSRFIEGGQFCDLCGGMDVQGFFCGHRPRATMPLPPDPETEESHRPAAEREDGFRGRGRYPPGGFGSFGGGFGAFGARAPGSFGASTGGFGAPGGGVGRGFGRSASRPPSRGAGQECRFFACTACASYIGGSGPKSCRNIEANGRRIEFVLDGHRVTLFIDGEDHGIVEAIHWDAPIRELCVQMDSLRTRSFQYELMTCSFLSALSVLVAQASEPAVLFSGHGQMVLRTQSETWTCIACDASVQQKSPQEQCWRCEQCENVSLCLDCLPDLHASAEAARQGMRSVAFLDLRGNNLEQLPAGLAEHAARCGGKVLFGDVSTPLSSATQASAGARKDHTTRQKASTSLFVNEYLMPGKYRFTGQLKDGKEHGQGTRFYADGCIMQTVFAEGDVAAKGTLTTSSGTYEGDIAKQDKKKNTKKKAAQTPRCTAAVGDTPAADATTGSSAGGSGSGEERKRVNIEEPLRSLVRTSSGDQPWCLQARPSGDLGRKTPPSTQSLIYCALIANIVGSDSTHPLANTRVQMDAVEEFWTEIFPPWRGWVREYRAAGVISRITPASVDASERAALVPDTTSEFHDTAGYGPYFIAEAQTGILGHLPATLAEVEAYVLTFWSSMSDQGAQLDFHPSGNGIMRYADGSVYSGEWKDGARYGKGSFDWPTKFEKRPRYEGDWQHDKLDGEGMLIWPDGTRFVGSFKKNCPCKGVVDTSVVDTSSPYTSSASSPYTSSASSPSFSVRFSCVAEIECERGHVLQMQDNLPSWTCDRCNKARQGSRRLRCDMCDYDCCKKCQTRLMGDTFNMLETSELPEVASRQEIGNICASLWSAIVKGASELYGARGCDLPLQDRIRVFRSHVENFTSFPDVSLQHPSASFDEFGNETYSETRRAACKITYRRGHNATKQILKALSGAGVSKKLQWAIEVEIQDRPASTDASGDYSFSAKPADSGASSSVFSFGATPHSTSSFPAPKQQVQEREAPPSGGFSFGAKPADWGALSSVFSFGATPHSTSSFPAPTPSFGFGATAANAPAALDDIQKMLNDASAGLSDFQTSGIKPFCLTRAHSLQPNPLSVRKMDTMKPWFVAWGRLLGCALWHGKILAIPLARFFCKRVLEMARIERARAYSASGQGPAYFSLVGSVIRFNRGSGGGPQDWNEEDWKDCPHPYLRDSESWRPDRGPEWRYRVTDAITKNAKIFVKCELLPADEAQLYEIIGNDDDDDRFGGGAFGNAPPPFGAFRGRGGYRGGRGGRGRGGGAFGRAFGAFPPSQENVSTSEDESVDDSDSDFSSSSSSQAEEQEAEERQRDGGGFGGRGGGAFGGAFGDFHGAPRAGGFGGFGAGGFGGPGGGGHGRGLGRGGRSRGGPPGARRRDGRQRFIAGWMPVSVTDAQVKNNQECEAAWASLRRQHQNLPYQGTFLAPEGYRPISGQPVRVKRLLHPPVFFSSAELEEIAKEEDAKDANVADRIQRAQDEAFRSAKEAGMSDADAERIASDAVEETCATIRAEKRKKEETTPLTDDPMDTTLLLGSNPGSGNLLGDMRGLQGLSVLPDWAMHALGLKDGDEVEIEALPPPLNQVGRAMVSCPTERSWHCGCKNDGSARCAQGFSCRDCRAISSPDLTGRLAHASRVSWRLSSDNLGEVEVLLRPYIGALLHKRGLLCIKVGMSMPIQWGSDVITVCAESIVDADNKAILEAALTAQTAHALLQPLQAQRPLLAETSKLEAGKGMSKWRLIALVIKTANLSGAIADDTLLVSDMMSDYLEQAARDDIDRDHIRRNEFAWLLRHKITELDDEGTLPPRFQSLARGAMQRELSTLHSGEGGAGEYFSQLALPPDSAREAITLSERGKRDLLRRWLRRKLYEEVQEQAFWVSRGLREVVSVGLLDLYSALELQIMLGGGPAVTDADLAAWQQHTAYGNGLEEGDERVAWFWQAVAAMSPAARAGVWRYATGRNQPPPESKGGIGGMDPKFNLVALSCDQIADGALVTAQTCFHELQLPRYSSAQVTARQLARSVEEGLQVPDDSQSFEATQRRLQMKVQEEMAKAAAYGEGLALQAQMRALFPNSYMCGKCSFGPVDHVACHSLASHHGERTAGGGVVRNNCPKCGWFSSQLEAWPRWDGRVWKEEDAEKNDPKAAAGGQTARDDRVE